MSLYKSVNTSFWRDAWVMKLTPVEKAFYLYLLTGGQTSLCGIFELPKAVAALEVGVPMEEVERILDKFEKAGKIRYDHETEEVYLVNRSRHNQEYFKSPTVMVAIKRELQSVKNREFAQDFIDQAKTLGFRIGEAAPQSTSGSVLPPVDTKIGAMATAYEQELGQMITPSLRDKLVDYQDLPDGWFVDACKEAAYHNAKNFAYVKSILDNWKVNGRNAKKQPVLTGAQAKREALWKP